MVCILASKLVQTSHNLFNIVYCYFYIYDQYVRNQNKSLVNRFKVQMDTYNGEHTEIKNTITHTIFYNKYQTNYYYLKSVKLVILL